MADMRPRAARRAPSILAAATLLLAGCGALPVTSSGPTSRADASPSFRLDATPSVSPPSLPTGPSPGATGPSPVAREHLRGTLAYSSDSGGNDDLYLLRLPDGAPVRLTDGPEKEFDPALSPDGTRIAYRRNPRTGSDAADIWVMNVDGTGKRNLTNAPERSNWAPAWTPGGRIAWSSMTGTTGELELWTMAADGSDARRVGEGWCEYAAPSPDGRSFVCAANVGGRYDLVIVDSTTGDRRPLTTTSQTEFGPSWSPDGAWIAFSRDLGEHWELLRVRPDGTDEQAVATEGVFPTWDPDGHLAWTGPGGINVANADGSGRIALEDPASFMSWVR